MFSQKFISELRLALQIALTIFSGVIFAALLLSFFFPEILLKISPLCISKIYANEECFMCGMTRAFIEISNGNFSNAYSLNQLSFYFYSIACLIIFAALFKLMPLKKRFRQIQLTKSTNQLITNKNYCQKLNKIH